jgi:hypothetical protein
MVLITEFFAVIFLVVAAMLLGTRIMVDILRTTRDLPEAERVMILQQSMLNDLRRDVWNASSLTPINGGVLLGYADGTKVSWTTDAAGVITRGVDREWRDLGQVSFRVEGPVVTLAWPTAEVRCVSQLMLGGRR